MGLSGKNVFVCAPASFLSMRSAEQAKVDVAYNHANVKLIGMSAGLSYAALGATHHAVSDFAVMASLPGMMVLSPSDAVQAGAMARYLCSFDGPAYVRMGRGASPDVYERSQACFHPGKINVLAHGTDGVLLATGETVYEALAAAQALKRLGISVSVLDCCSIKPFDQETLSQEAVGKWALTIEEHGALGGIGDAASRVLGPAGIRQDRLCVPDEWAPCASSQTLRKLYNLDFDGIIKKVMQLRGSF
jgi:transketolase